MKNLFTTKRLCRAAVIAALYAVIAIVQPYSSSPIQCRLSEAFTILPLFFPEAVTGLFVGCFLANVMNGAADMILGSIATLLAALCTYFIGRAIRPTDKKRNVLRLVLGELAPVIINAFLVPVVFIIDGSIETAYIVEVAFLAAGEAIAVGVFGTALYIAISALQKKGVRVFCDTAPAKTTTKPESDKTTENEISFKETEKTSD
jgi:uncharacterized membrane protein